jgi:hypothetical protein
MIHDKHCLCGRGCLTARASRVALTSLAFEILDQFYSVNMRRPNKTQTLDHHTHEGTAYLADYLTVRSGMSGGPRGTSPCRL